MVMLRPTASERPVSMSSIDEMTGASNGDVTNSGRPSGAAPSPTLPGKPVAPHGSLLGWRRCTLISSDPVLLLKTQVMRPACSSSEVAFDEALRGSTVCR